jgi:hypothetical protein
MIHPLAQITKDTAKDFDFVKFRNQVVMAIAVGLSVQVLKVAWIKFTEHRKSKA